MFTVKAVCANGCDEVFQADFVCRQIAHEDDGKSNFVQVTFSKNGVECHCPITSGCVYVMNEDGQTVSTYALGWKEKWHTSVN